MTYQQTIDFIHSRPRFSKKPGLETMRILMQKLGNPQNNLKFVHIAGTNGKGSCAAMLASVLKKAGYKTGLNISPYVINFCERFQINGQMITPDLLCDIAYKVKTVCEQMPEENQPNEFEVVTAIAFLYFANEQCDIVCLEVGLGGRQDPTNIIATTLVSCIMKIGIDHTAQLGETIAEIAGEKAGIIKKETTVISYPTQHEAAKQIIENVVAKQNAQIIIPDMQDLKIFQGDIFCNRIDYGGYEITLPFVGKHQAQNAMVVIDATLSLCEKGFDIQDEAIIEGIEKASFPARIEIISKTPLVILDGCHNIDSAKALADTLQNSNMPKIAAVIGVLQDKNPVDILQILKPVFDTVYTVAVDNPRAMPAEELAKIASGIFKKTVPCQSIQNAIELAQKDANGICVCGSLYLVAQARDMLLDF